MWKSIPVFDGIIFAVVFCTEHSELGEATGAKMNAVQNGRMEKKEREQKEKIYFRGINHSYI